MSECRSLTNICGNAVAAVIIAKMEGEVDMNEFRAALGGRKEHERYLGWRKKMLARWWFQIFFIFTPTWGNDPIWLIFLKWVETTN